MHAQARLKGENEIKLNEETLIRAMELYLTVLFNRGISIDAITIDNGDENATVVFNKGCDDNTTTITFTDDTEGR